MQPAAVTTTTASNRSRYPILINPHTVLHTNDVEGDGTTAIIVYIGGRKKPPKFRVGLVLACPPDLAGNVIDTINQHIENGNSFCRSTFSSAVGGDGVGLVPIDAGFNRGEAPDLPEAMKEFARTKRPEWNGTCGYNVDWRDLYTDRYWIPAGKQLLSGVELPTPERGYPNLDVIGCLGKVKIPPSPQRCLYRALQQRTLIECGVAIHINFLRVGTFAVGGQTVVPASRRQPLVDVLFLTVDLPTNAEMLDLTMDEDMRQRLQSYYIDTPLPERMAYVAIVPPGFELGAGADAPERDQLLPHNPNPDIMITCRKCRVAFKHTYAEQCRFREESLSEPKTCRRCREARRSRK